MPNPVAIGETAPQTALPAQVDIYDFDKTLVPFDSGSLFIGYCALHYPWVLVYLPVWFIACLLFALRILSLQKFKNLCFGFLPLVPVQRAAKGFWEKHLHQVYPWFTQKKRPAVIISASPDFLLEELQRRLGLPYLLCTRHNPKTGRILGQNCRGEEKVRRFHRAFPGVQVVDVDILQFAGLAACAHGVDQALGGRSHGAQVDVVARFDNLDGLFGGRKFDLGSHFYFKFVFWFWLAFPFADFSRTKFLMALSV